MLKRFVGKILISLWLSTPVLGADEPTMVEKVLPSGLRIVTMENPGSQTVSVNVFISAGSLDEDESTTGLAHFYEHMFFRGTPNLSGLEFKKAIEDNGGITNATTAKDMTHYFITLPSEQAEKGLELLADALIRADLDQTGIDVERDVVLEEYRLGENNPGRQAVEGLYKLAYGSHPYGRSTIGTKERIKAYNRADFLRWRTNHYGPKRCTVVVVGDIDAQAIAQKANFYFAGFRGPEAEVRRLVEPPVAPAEPVLGEGGARIGGAVIMVGYPAPSAHDKKDVYAMDVLSFILGQGSSSMLHRSLVKEKELVSSVGVDYLTPRQRGLVILSAMGESKKSTEIREAMLEQVEALKAGSFTEEDLKRAKAYLLQSHLQSKETNSGKADNIGFYAALGVPGFWKDYDQQIAAVPREEVLRVAEKYLGGGYWGYTLRPTGKQGK